MVARGSILARQHCVAETRRVAGDASFTLVFEAQLAGDVESACHVEPQRVTLATCDARRAFVD